MLLPPMMHHSAWKLHEGRNKIDRAFGRWSRKHWSRLLWLPERHDSPRIPGHLRPSEFGTHLTRILNNTRHFTNAMTVVVDVHPPNRHLLRLGSAYPVRREKLQRVLAEVVAERERVAIVRLAELEEELGGSSSAFPDGIHLSPNAHRLLGEKIATAYLEMIS
jgi:hypothetical protein